MNLFPLQKLARKSESEERELRKKTVKVTTREEEGMGRGGSIEKTNTWGSADGNPCNLRSSLPGGAVVAAAALNQWHHYYKDFSMIGC